ncbi:MAG TPA: ABC transporter permease [Patescibacteria group bacterium]|nr:ABC transporter permease [Patescibacteria group bacterium]
MKYKKSFTSSRIYQLISKEKVEYLRYYFDFLWAMTEKEIKARYKKAVFGFLWVILNPILQMVVIGLIFSYFIKIPNYFLFLFSGLLPWQFFSLSLSKATPSIVYERTLLQKARFPIEAIPLSLILSNFINMIISFVLLIIVLSFWQKVIFPQILLLIPALLWLLIFTIGLSLLTTSLNVKWRDVSFFIQTVLILWFYATPILYHLSLIPRILHPVFNLNPLTSVFELVHISLINQGFLDFQTLLLNLLLTIIVLIAGILVFRKESKYFSDWL